MRMVRQHMWVGCLAVVVFVMMNAMVDIRQVGAEVSPAMLATLRLGTVTSVGSTSIGIGGVEYRVRANAEILDHKGSEITLPEVLVRSEARYHLTKDNEVDMLVVRRPQ